MHTTIENVKERVAEAIRQGVRINPRMIHAAIVMLPAAGRHLINSEPVFKEEGFHKILTETTRPLENHEQDGIDYHQRTGRDFSKENKTDEIEIIEETVYKVSNYRYGLNLHEFLPRIAAGQSCLFSVSTKGAAALKELFEDAICIVYVKVSTSDWMVNMNRKFDGIVLAHQKKAMRTYFGNLELVQLEDPDFVNNSIDVVIPYSTDYAALAKTICERVRRSLLMRSA